LAKLESIFKLKSGNSLPAHKIVSGEFPVYGGNGIVGYHNEFMVDKPTIVIGRVGEYCGSIHLSENKSWITGNGLYPLEYFYFSNVSYKVLCKEGTKSVAGHCKLQQ
jgi:type I restriction enzyme, S subunit